MKKRLKFGVIFLFLIFIGLLSSSEIKALGLEGIPVSNVKGRELIAMGRTRVSEKGLELISSGAYFSFEFEGNEFEMKISLPAWVQHSYLQYEVDGLYKNRIKIDKRDEKISISAGTGGKHVVTIYKATEANSGGVFIEEIRATNVTPMTIAKKPLIEYIGDSITCGAASDDSDIPCGKGSYVDYHNAYLSYGPRVARAVNANFIITAASGKGVYRNWNNDGPTLPFLYKRKSLMPNDKEEWDQKIFKPDVISIALGTNDLSDGDKKTERQPFDKNKFVDEYLKFIDYLKSVNPEAKIVLLSSPTVGVVKGQLLEDAMQTIKAAVDNKYKKATPVELIYFKGIKPAGCNGHPSINQHEMMANEILKQFAEILDSK